MNKYRQSYGRPQTVRLDKYVDAVYKAHDLGPWSVINWLPMDSNDFLPPDAPITDVCEVLGKLADSLTKQRR
jgi:hypothetical protein